MKICLIVDDYMPDSIKVAAKMMHELACEYIKQGHYVSVLTPNSKIINSIEFSTLDGVNIISFKSGEIKNVPKVKRVINETLLSFNAWQSCKQFFKENPHDLIIYYSPTIFFGSLVGRLKKLWNVKSYLILRDIFPQWAIDNKILKEKSLITSYFKYFENINYKNADTIGLMSGKNLELFEKHYKNKKNLEVLYNWTDISKVETSSSKYKKELNIENKVVFFYGGNMGHAQDMMNIIRLAENLQDYKEAHFILVGAGDEVELIKNHINTNHLSNITLLPSVNQNDFKQMLVEFDIGLFTLHKDHKTHNFPGKLLGYMLQELPILGSINPDNDLKDLIDSYDAGLISMNGEDDLLKTNAIKLLNIIERKKISDNANKLLKDKFDVHSIAKQILEGEVK